MPRLSRRDSADVSSTGNQNSSEQLHKKKDRGFMTSLKRLLGRQQRGCDSAAQLRPSSSRSVFVPNATSSTELLSPGDAHEGSFRTGACDSSAPHSCRPPPRSSSSMPVLMPLPGSNSSASGLPSFSGSPANSGSGRKAGPAASSSMALLQLPAIDASPSNNSCGNIAERTASALLSVQGPASPLVGSRLRHLGVPSEQSPPPQHHQQQLQRSSRPQQQQQQQLMLQQASCNQTSAAELASLPAISTGRSCASLPLILLGQRNYSGFGGGTAAAAAAVAVAAAAATQQAASGQAEVVVGSARAAAATASEAATAAASGSMTRATPTETPVVAPCNVRPSSAASAMVVPLPRGSVVAPAATPTAAAPAPAARPVTSNLLVVCPAMPEAMRRSVWRFSDYVIGGRMYKGEVSSVYKAVCNHSGLKVVLKVYSLGRVADNALHTLVREVRIHTDLAHDNILTMYGVFEESNRLILVLERAGRGDLFNLHRNLPNCRMSEDQLRVLVLAPLLEALVYLHGRGVCHRDIKPENLLMTGNWQLRLADFGAAINLTQERAVTRTGTMDYMAPEVERCPLKMLPEDNKDNRELAYTTAADVWSVGVLAYEMLVGFPPFINCQGRSEEGIHIGTGDGGTVGESFRELHFPHFVSAGGQDFISVALAERPGDRPTAAQLLRHPWLKHAVRQYHTRQQQAAEVEAQQPQQQQAQVQVQQQQVPQQRLREHLSSQMLSANPGGLMHMPSMPSESPGEQTGGRTHHSSALKPNSSVRMW